MRIASSRIANVPIMRLRKPALSIPLVILTAIALSGCTITAIGSGTVTIVSNDDPATQYDPVSEEGTVAYVCAGGSSRCHQTDPYLYSYFPAEGTDEWVVSPGFPVVNRENQTVGLPAGSYTLQVTEYDVPPIFERTNAVFIDVFSTSEKDLTIWHQSHARHAQDAQCPDEWQASWAQWPNAGTGGFVCNRQIYAYYPDEPVR